MGATGWLSPWDGCGLHDVISAATIKHKLTIPDNSDMAKLPLFRPARLRKLTQFAGLDSPEVLTNRNARFHFVNWSH